MTNGTEKYIETVSYLARLYDFCNEKLFGGELIRPVITVQRDERNKTCGWWSVKKVWRENVRDEGEHELNITAQQLDRPINEIAATLIHEMCHQYASFHDLKDTSRSGNYHNKLYKQIAEAHGLIVGYEKSIGWSVTSLSIETAVFVSDFVKVDPPNFIFRLPVMKGQEVKTSSTRKYVCPACGNSVRATKEVRIMCLDCTVPMLEEV